MIEARIFRKEAIEHGAEEERARALKRLLVDGDRDLDSARDPYAAALADTPHDRPAIDVTNAADAALGGAIVHKDKNRQRLPNRLGVVSSASLDQSEMIGRKQVHEPPGDRAGVRRFAAATQLPDNRLARRRSPRATYATKV